MVGAEKFRSKLRPEKTWQHHIGREFNSPHLHILKLWN